MFGNLISKFILGNELSFHKYSFLSPIDYSLKKYMYTFSINNNPIIIDGYIS